MKILFLHSWQSVPGGVKPTFLSEHECEVINPKLDDDDFDAAVRTAQTAFDLHQPDVVVGSSRGGAVAMNIHSGTKPLVLLCPAWKKWGKVKTLKSNAVVLHSRKDEVIPFEDSEELIAKSKLPSDLLLEVGYDHRLADTSSLSALLWACQQLADHAELSTQGGPSQGMGSMQGECSYVCDACGEEIIIPLDLAEGNDQKYVEDCPVCCRANIIHVAIDEDGVASAWSEPEQDYD